MKENKTKNIGVMYFSPTNTTAKICKAIASGMGKDVPEDFNITYPDFRAKLISNPKTMLENIDHLIVGAPVYAGKLPVQVIECMNALVGEGKICTIIVSYGNREFGKALRNMAEILIKKGFKVSAAGAFIGQHSYKDIIPIAIGRPDKKDLEQAFNFGKKCTINLKHLSIEEIPEQIDWISKSKNYFKSVSVKYISENCTHCGICAKHCPIGIISDETGNYKSIKSKADCIACVACVFECKFEARILGVSFINKLILRTHLKKASLQRLEPLTIFP